MFSLHPPAGRSAVEGEKEEEPSLNMSAATSNDHLSSGTAHQIGSLQVLSVASEVVKSRIFLTFRIVRVLPLNRSLFQSSLKEGPSSVRTLWRSHQTEPRFFCCHICAWVAAFCYQDKDYAEEYVLASLIQATIEVMVTEDQTLTKDDARQLSKLVREQVISTILHSRQSEQCVLYMSV